ncbi:MAG: mannose-phosphate guanylyltransferase [Gemmatimonadales bacterium]|jgi:mannose-1-phosphate guanylyltransferase|nr:mannose-phosphate guanylyltransferase [Gemmatimonadales bacterium]
MRWAVVLAGGSGTRFWPLSTPQNPKQLLPLTGSTSTAEESIDRLAGLVPKERILVVTGAALADQLRQRLKLPASNILVEPRAASTAPALIWATAEAQRRDPDAEVLSLHADWAIGDGAAFRRTADMALTTARRYERLVTVGVVPSRPETGYGYIVPGPPLGDGARMVARFSEKPDAATALDLMAAGALWNSGLFAWTAERLLLEAEAHTPEVAPYLPALRAGDIERFFREVTPISIDVGLLERSGSVAVVSGAFAWDDIGTWQALTRVRPKDPSGNVVVGSAFTHESQDCIIWSDRDTVVLSGVRDLIVVQANGRILVMPTERAASMKQLLDALPPDIRDVES